MNYYNTPLLELPQDYLEKLKARIEARVSIVATGCWEWTGWRFPYGYGMISVKHKSLTAHRTYYQLVKGNIAVGLVLDHICVNPPCINPDHLEPVTNLINLQRSPKWPANRIYCPQGHEYTPENIYQFPSNPNTRKCRTCELHWMSRRGAQRTLEYHAKGLNSKGRPLQRRIDKRFQ